MPVVLALILSAGAARARPPLLAAPQDVTVTAAYRQATLAWSASVGAQGYNIYRGTAAGRENITPIATRVAGPPYVDTKVTNGTRYYYKVKAVGGGGPGAVSAEVSDTPHASVDAGYYLVTYWAGNDAPLMIDASGDNAVARKGSRGPGRVPTRVTATFTFQPSGANDEPPSCLILTTSRRDEGPPDFRHAPPVRTDYSVKNDPGPRFSVVDTTTDTPKPLPTPPHVPVPRPPAFPLPTMPALTPYQANPYLFAGREEAARALRSPDILLRRSGVEWLGRWTQASGEGGPPGRDMRRQEFSRMLNLVPALTRGVREMPNQDSDEATRLLALLGPPARSAIPAVCAALARPAGGDSMASDKDSLLTNLARLCGGPYALAPTLTALLRAPDPETRRAAAGALRFCDGGNVSFTSPHVSGAYAYMSPIEERQWRRAFLETAFPAVLLRLDDDAGDVRLAAAQTLEHWTYSPEAPWPLALAPLARAASSPDPALRLAALRTLAFMPGDVSPAAPALRAALHGAEAERPWALAALSHAAWTGRARTVDAFLPDLAAPDAVQRRLAAADLRLAIGPLWSGGFWPAPEPLPGWTNDSRLMRVSTAPDATAGDSQTRLLDALVRAAADPDAAVRRDAASSLEQIGAATDRVQGRGRFLAGDTGTAAVTAALAQAASFLRETNPAAAKRLEDLQAHITSPRSVF